MYENAAARELANLHGRISDLEENIEKLEEKLDTISGKMYKHFAEAQLDSMRIAQVVEDVNSLKSSIRYAYRTAGFIVCGSLFGIFLTVITSSNMGG